MKTLNCLMFSDTHGGAGAVEVLEVYARSEDLDLVLLAGDFSNFEAHHRRLFERVRDLDLACAFVSGNCETQELCTEVAEEYCCAYVDYAVTRILGITVVGVGAYDLFSPAHEKRTLDFARKLEAAKLEGPRVLLSHEPPSAWVRCGQDCGSGAVASVVRKLKPDLVVVGHIHESGPCCEPGPGGMPIINPGPTGSLVRICLKSGDVEVLGSE